MPHQCTNCGRAFDDGSKEMLSGCPDCGGNKFQFHPGGDEVPDEPTDAEPPEPPEPDSSVARTVGSAAASVRDLVGSSSPPESHPEAEPSEPSESPSGPEPATTDMPTSREAEPAGPTTREDTAQADARSAVVAPDELPSGADAPADASAGSVPGGDAPAPGDDREGLAAAEAAARDQPADEDRPSLDELRRELNDQFESIRIVEPGQYELNLMELYDRQEYIIALQEDGRYSIQVPENWIGDE
jgi:predicted  nucleic acid-binding Zn-ribbon protein